MFMNKDNSIMYAEILEQPIKVANSLEVNLPIIKAIAEEVAKRKIKTVVFAARGSSEHACQVAKYLFETYCGMIASISSPSVITHYHGNIDLSNVLTIAVSQSGGAQDVFEVMQKTVEQGGLCVSITNERDSIMANIGQYRLNLECGKENSITAAKSYMCQLSLLIALAANISQDHNLLSLINEIPSIVNKSIISLEPQIVALVKYIRNTDKLLIIARGLLYGLALETELKIQETCYLDARTYASSDYRHGPVATTQRFVPVIFFVGDSKTDECVITLNQRLKSEYDIFSIVVTNKDNIENADIHIKIDQAYDGIKAVISIAVFSQMLSCLLSIARGYNPDAPIGVSKHTVTR